MDSRVYWVWLQQCLGPASGKVRRIVEEYISIAQFYEAGRADWRLMGIFTRKELDQLSDYTLEQAADVIAVHEASGVAVITPEDVRYPDKLREIYDFPAVLYVKGVLPDLDDKLSIAIVGTRKSTRNGLAAAKTISRDLARNDVVVVSGGALGIDTAAHTGVLEADGETICVLGCGIGYDYLPESGPMRRAIAKRGAVISEYPIGTPPLKGNFPLRNRIISGLCDGTLVVEAGTSSGSLITARDAREQNRDVFAVPGAITQTTAEGTNNLIKSGAKMVTEAADILEEYYTRYPYLRPQMPVFQGMPAKKQEKPVEKQEKPAEKRLTQAEFQRMCREKKWDIDLSRLPSEAEVAGTKKNQPATAAVERKPVPIVPAVKSVPAPKKPLPVIPVPEVKVPEKPAPAFDGSPEAVKVLAVLTKEPVHISELCAKTGLSTGQILASITELEMEDLVETYAGSHYSLSGNNYF